MHVSILDTQHGIRQTLERSPLTNYGKIKLGIMWGVDVGDFIHVVFYSRVCFFFVDRLSHENRLTRGLSPLTVHGNILNIFNFS